jgi:hypothetical protein
MENKKLYERPVLRKVRLEVKTSVLATCNNSVPGSAKTQAVPCNISSCSTYP